MLPARYAQCFKSAEPILLQNIYHIYNIISVVCLMATTHQNVGHRRWGSKSIQIALVSLVPGS